MKIFKRILSILGIIVVAMLIVGAIIYVYYGGLTTIVFSNPAQGGEILIYKEVTGDYANTSNITDEVYNQLKNIGIETYKGFGIFYDNPDEVERTKCRSEIGCILEPNDIDKLPEIEKYFKVKTFPTGQYTSTDFPFKGTISIFIGMFKVYSAINVIKEEKNELYVDGPIMEIYNMKDNIITYRLCGEIKKESNAIKAPENVTNR